MVVCFMSCKVFEKFKKMQSIPKRQWIVEPRNKLPSVTTTFVKNHLPKYKKSDNTANWYVMVNSSV